MAIEVKERQIGIGNVSEYEIVKKQIIDDIVNFILLHVIRYW